jgi:hypothetical protein
MSLHWFCETFPTISLDESCWLTLIQSDIFAFLDAGLIENRFEDVPYPLLLRSAIAVLRTSGEAPEPIREQILGLPAVHSLSTLAVSPDPTVQYLLLSAAVAGLRDPAFGEVMHWVIGNPTSDLFEGSIVPSAATALSLFHAGHAIAEGDHHFRVSTWVHRQFVEWAGVQLFPGPELTPDQAAELQCLAMTAILDLTADWTVSRAKEVLDLFSPEEFAIVVYGAFEAATCPRKDQILDLVSKVLRRVWVDCDADSLTPAFHCLAHPFMDFALEQEHGFAKALRVFVGFGRAGVELAGVDGFKEDLGSIEGLLNSAIDVENESEREACQLDAATSGAVDESDSDDLDEPPIDHADECDDDESQSDDLDEPPINHADERARDEPQSDCMDVPGPAMEGGVDAGSAEMMGDGTAEMMGDGTAEMMGDGTAEMMEDGTAEMMGDGTAEMSLPDFIRARRDEINGGRCCPQALLMLETVEDLELLQELLCYLQ